MSVEQNEFLSQVQLQILAEQAIKQYPSDYQDRSNYCVSLKMQRFRFRLVLPDMHFESIVPTITANWIYKVSLNG